jgi:Lon protease-like protein
VCLGRIFQEERLSDGRYNLLLHGVARARIREEAPTGKLYRTARVDLLEDGLLACGKTERELRRRLGQAIAPWFAAQSASLAHLRKLLEGGLDLGPLCDIFGFALPLEVEVKLQMLEELNVERRARLLLRHLEAKLANTPAETARKFPPEFSAN